MEQARQIRGSAKSVGALYPVSSPALSTQQKPMFQVLENSAITDAETALSMTAKNGRRSDKEQVLCKCAPGQFADASPVGEPTYPFSFPLSDLLISEFNQVDNAFSAKQCSEIVTVTKLHKSLQGSGIYPSRLSPNPKAASSSLWTVAQLIYQKVVSRKPVAHQPHPENLPQYIVCRVEETLECGHVRDAHFIEGVETLTARKRACHECQGFIGGLILKKPNASIQRSMEFHKKKKQAGFSPWFSLGWAVLCASLLIVAVSRSTRHTYTFQYPGNYVRIIQNLDPCLPDGSCGYRFKIQSVVDGIAQPETAVRFCSGLQPRFEAGHVLSWIRYTNLGSCLSIDGYDVVRDSSGLPVPAPNCKPDYSTAPIAGHLACDGGRANFE